MKYNILLCIVLFITINVHAQQSMTSQNDARATSNTEASPSNSTSSKTPVAKENEKTEPCKDCCKDDLCNWGKFYIALPWLSFLLLVFVVLLSARKAGFNFKQAFYCDDPEEKVERSDVNPDITIKTTIMKDGEPVYYPSTSKLIAFLTGLTTLIVIISFITYYAYCMVNCRTLPEFKELFEVLMGLGLGIIPYGISKVTNVSKQS